MTSTRPLGLSAGSMGLILAWLGGAAIARLTGATPVVILLAVGAVAALVAAVESRLELRRVELRDLTAPPSATQGRAVPVELIVDSRRPVWVDLELHGEIIASGWTPGGGEARWATEAAFPRRGVVAGVRARVRTGGSLGLLWWSRRHRLRIDPMVVAAAPNERDVPVERRAISGDGTLGGRSGAIAGDLDGLRPWREGDSERWVHWASSMRTGELMVHDRRRPSDSEWIVRPRTDTDDPDAEAGAARRALERGLQSGARTSVAIGDRAPVPIPDHDAAAAWSAMADLGTVEPATTRWWQRGVTAEPITETRLRARIWAAAASLLGLFMLTDALGLGVAWNAIVIVATVAAVIVSGRSLVSGEPPSPIVRGLAGLAALAGLGMVAASTGHLQGLLPFLRGPLPQVLIILILIHGFECRDRRTVRVAIGISAVVVMYASAFRVDDRLIWWLGAWLLAAGASLASLARPPRPSPGFVAEADLGGWLPRIATLGATGVLSVAVLAVVPVPDGPARLTLPTIVQDAEPIDQPGALAGPDGEVADAADIDAPAGDRAPVGQSGGYTGFASSMDTSVRGSLSDEVVMRVRAPAADFWRGQTFTRFDGRHWYADEETGLIERGPTIDVPETFGDLPETEALEYDELIQTFHLEVDMPNLVFHAYKPTTVILDADVFLRGDGALRASSTLPAGSVYTVVSSRARVDADVLRRQGHVDERLNERGLEFFARHLELPASTSDETVALAAELAEGAASTYDVIRAYEGWMNANVEYDLDAPLPDPGEDAVHDFLFDSRLGFCEQIASSLTIMLRSQGIPARLATGYTSGTRDRVSGVFEVKASDAHAWVEVWFPEVGWQAFDPTASVPLSANSELGSIGSELASGAGSYVGDNAMTLVGIAVAVAAAVVLWRLFGLVHHRRRRGRWGTLQDRFTARAVDRGARAGAPNPELAGAWTADDDAAVARLVASRLDRIAFAPDSGSHSATDDDVYADTRRLVDSLPGPEPARTRPIP